MSDPRDDDAFTWAGDDRLQAPIAPPPPRLARAEASAAERQTGGLALVALGVFGGVAVLEAAGWSRVAFTGPLATTLTTGDGSVLALAAFAAAVVGHVAAVAAPIVWVLVVVLRIAATAPRIAWFALGAVVLLPWPIVLGIG